MSDFLADEILTLADVELVHVRVHAQSMELSRPMSEWSDEWAEAWRERLDASRAYISYMDLAAPAQIAAVIWVYGAMFQLPGHDGHKRMSTGAMEAQVVRFGYAVRTVDLELSDMTYEIVERCENGGDRVPVIDDVAVWIDERMS
jgi:hypothetical protein